MSRVATGFLNGVYSSVTGWQVIRTSDAHSWVEAWIDGTGWVTYDPTPPDPNGSGGVLSGLPLYSDAVGQLWQEWVIGYDFQRQRALVAKLDQSGPTSSMSWLATFRLQWSKFQNPGPVTWIAILLVGAALLLCRRFLLLTKRWLRGRRIESGRITASDSTELYLRMLDTLEERGFRKPSWITPSEFAGMLPSSPTADLVEHATRVYQLSRFGGQKEAAVEMAGLLTQIQRMQVGT